MSQGISAVATWILFFFPIFIIIHFIDNTNMAIQAIDVDAPFKIVAVLDKYTMVSETSIDFEIIKMTPMFSE